MEDNQQQEIDTLITEIQDVMRQVLRRMRQEFPIEELSMAQVSVIARLEVTGGLTGAELARAEGVKPQSISATVAALEAEGLIQRSPDPNDGRRIVLSLTEAGRQVRATRRAVKQQWLNSIIEKLSTEERRELQRGFQLLGRITK